MRQFPVMLFAAGFGTRMGDLTRNRPKPLLEVGGASLLSHALRLADKAGLQTKVVNAHYRAEQIADHVAGRGVAVSYEAEILETGGGLRAALPMLGPGPLMTLNTDAVWTGRNALQELAEAWRDDQMDALLLLAPLAQTVGHEGTGDFTMDAAGRIARASGRPGLVYLGAQILRTEMLATIAEPVFSLNRLWDRMIAEGRAYGTVHSGRWCDVGRPEGIALAEAMLAQSGDD
jgi:MurNAc alpha-1-phosphate uridylyltransferase